MILVRIVLLRVLQGGNVKYTHLTIGPSDYATEGYVIACVRLFRTESSI